MKSTRLHKRQRTPAAPARGHYRTLSEARGAARRTAARLGYGKGTPYTGTPRIYYQAAAGYIFALYDQTAADLAADGYILHSSRVNGHWLRSDHELIKGDPPLWHN